MGDFSRKSLSCLHFFMFDWVLCCCFGFHGWLVCLGILRVFVCLQKIMLFLFTNNTQFPVKVFARKKNTSCLLLIFGGLLFCVPEE